MAKENTIRLLGEVLFIQCIKDENDEFVSARATVRCVSRAYMTNEYVQSGQLKQSDILIHTRTKSVIPYMDDAKIGDIVDIKGTFASQDVDVQWFCPKCKQQAVIGHFTTTYIDPIYFGVRARKKSTDFPMGMDKDSIAEYVKNNVVQTPSGIEKDISAYVQDIQINRKLDHYITAAEMTNIIWKFIVKIREGNDCFVLDNKGLSRFLRKQGEIGNTCYIFGTLTREPDLEKDFYAGDANHAPSFHFQVAVNRIRHIYTDDENKKTDFLPVVVFGEKAKIYANCLKKGSTIYITGPIITKKFYRRFTCQNCGREYSHASLKMILKAQNIVFVKNCLIPATSVGEEDVVDRIEKSKENTQTLIDNLLSDLNNEEPALPEDTVTTDNETDNTWFDETPENDKDDEEDEFWFDTMSDDDTWDDGEDDAEDEEDDAGDEE